MAAADAVDAIFQRAINPRAFDGAIDMLRKVGDRTGAARQRIQGRDDIAGQRLLIKGEMADNVLQIAVLLLHQLVQPVHQLNIRVAAQFTKGGCAFQRGKQQRIQFAEEYGTADF